MKLYIGNLPFGIDDEKLRKLFSAHGKVEEATVIKDKFSGRSKGFGFVTFATKEEAEKAIKELNDKEIEGRNLKVSEARPMTEDRPRREFGGGRNFGGSRRRF